MVYDDKGNVELKCFCIKESFTSVEHTIQYLFEKAKEILKDENEDNDNEDNNLNTTSLNVKNDRTNDKKKKKKPAKYLNVIGFNSGNIDFILLLPFLNIENR
jgi:hypothetical protein